MRSEHLQCDTPSAIVVCKQMSQSAQIHVNACAPTKAAASGATLRVGSGFTANSPKAAISHRPMSVVIVCIKVSVYVKRKPKF